LYREEAQQLTDRLSSLKLEICQIENQFSSHVEENKKTERQNELSMAEVKSKQARVETELKNRENVKRKAVPHPFSENLKTKIFV
jgi:hypothetical protein